MLKIENIEQRIRVSIFDRKFRKENILVVYVAKYRADRHVTVKMNQDISDFTHDFFVFK